MDSTLIECAWRLQDAIDNSNIYATACIDHTAKKMITMIVQSNERPIVPKQESPVSEPMTVEAILSDLELLVISLFNFAGKSVPTGSGTDLEAVRLVCRDTFQEIFEGRIKQLEEKLGGPNGLSEDAIRDMIAHQITTNETAQLNKIRAMISAASPAYREAATVRALTQRLDNFEKTVLGSYRALLMGKIGAAAQMPKRLEDIQLKLAVLEMLDRKITALGYAQQELMGKRDAPKQAIGIHSAELEQDENLRDLIDQLSKNVNDKLLRYDNVLCVHGVALARIQELDAKASGLEAKASVLEAKSLSFSKVKERTEALKRKTEVSIQQLTAKAFGMETKTDSLEAKTDSLEGKTDSFQEKIDEVEGKVIDVQSRTGDVESKLDKMSKQNEALRREFEEFKATAGGVGKAVTEDRLLVLLNNWASRQSFATEDAIVNTCTEVCAHQIEESLSFAIASGRVASRLAPQGQPVLNINPNAQPFTPRKWL